MPRTPRNKSNTGIYHVVFRGINRQQIFEDNEDYDRFLFLLKQYRETSGYQLYAYCLMPNHIHLLIKEGTEDLGQAFRRIGASFVYWYNLKYDRTGHLFQDRYKSEAVEDDAYLLTVIRYIHRNPVKAGLCQEPEEYRYSSLADYESNPLIDSAPIFGMLDREEFYRYQHIRNDDLCLDVAEQEKKRLSDQEAKRMMEREYHCSNPSEFQASEKGIQEKILRMLLKSGASLRQISRLTGATIGIIRKYS
ncbi:MAG: transposase [Oscillospiraceae bacterium]|nr:transposase [Oscillospiraceae bacterium]MBR0392129.1 transposase [Oscillospiraceae bacterium]